MDNTFLGKSSLLPWRHWEKKSENQEFSGIKRKLLTSRYTISQKPSRSVQVTGGSPQAGPLSHLSINPLNLLNFFFNNNCVCPMAEQIIPFTSWGKSAFVLSMLFHSLHQDSNLSVSLFRTDLQQSFRYKYRKYKRN